MKDNCRLFANIELVLGMIGSLVIAYYYGRKIDTNYIVEVTYTRDWIQTCCIFIGCIFVVAIIYIILCALSEILYNQEKILYQLSNVSEDNKVIKSSVDANTVPKGSWRCPKCDKINPNYTGTCGCGCEKPN